MYSEQRNCFLKSDTNHLLQNINLHLIMFKHIKYRIF